MGQLQSAIKTFRLTVLLSAMCFLWSFPSVAQVILSKTERLVHDSLNYANRSNKTAVTGIHSNIKARYEIVPHVATESHTEIIPKYTGDTLTFILRLDQTALEKPSLLLKDLGIISTLVTFRNIGKNGNAALPTFTNSVDIETYERLLVPHGIAELIENARLGSPTAMSHWNELQIQILKYMGVNSHLEKQYSLQDSILFEAREDLIKKQDALEKDSEKYKRQQRQQLSDWKKDTQALERLEAQSLKLNDLILNNDRAGVARMLETYLPWPAMEPVEAHAWKVWVEAIRNPHTDADRTTVAFRGMDYETDKIQRKKTPQGEVFGFMSTVLTKNQGNYTRRLRSLSTNRETNGVLIVEKAFKKNPSLKMMDQFYRHSGDPIASSFLSFTLDPFIADLFSGADNFKNVGNKKIAQPGGGLLVVKMDSRRLFPNITSVITQEVELLAPLIIFPDEVIEYHEGKFSSDVELKEFVKDLTARTGIAFDEVSRDRGIPQKMMAAFTEKGIKFTDLIFDVKKETRSCHKVFFF